MVTQTPTPSATLTTPPVRTPIPAIAPTSIPTAQPATAPEAPSGLIATRDKERRIDLSWTAPSNDGGADITGYHVEVSEDGAAWSDLTADTGTTHSHTDLNVETTRHYRVSAINSAGTSLASSIATGITAPATFPNAPSDLTATTDEEKRIDLSWTAPSGDGGANIAGYRIEVSDDDSTWFDIVANTESTATTYSQTELEVDTTRQFRVSAINSAGTGSASNVATGMTAPATVPTVSRGLFATRDAVRQIDLKWSTPSDNGGADITGYRIEVSADGSAWSNLVANTENIATSHSHTGLRGETTRHYRVFAINSAGTGPASNVATGISAPATVPDAPTELTATAGLERRIDLSWTTPPDDGGADITGYRIEVSTSGSTWSDLTADTGTTDTTYPDTGLRGGTTRHYRVSAINSAGTGPESNIATGTTAPATLPEAPSALTATQDVERRIDLSWTTPSDDGGADITGYRIEMSTDGSDWSDLVTNTETATTTHSHTGLRGGATRHYRVSSINSAGTGPASDVATGITAPATVPVEPIELTATMGLERRIDISWSTPDDDGGADVTGYRIETSDDGSSWNDLVSNTGAIETTHTHSGLRGGATHHYRVSAINSAGTGEASITAIGITAPAIAPDEPTELTATANWEKWIDLSWTVPADDGGANITGYRIEVSEDDSRWRDLSADTGDSAATYSHLGLEVEITRHYRVSAINSAGTGPASNMATGTTILSTSADDRAVLVSLYNATDGANWNNNNNWDTDLPLSRWNGVATDRRGRVTALSLQGNRLRGEIPPELGNLVYLKNLSLADNRLTGDIPPKLGSLLRLEVLRLGQNQLRGDIPSELGSLSRLWNLSLSENQLSGEVPPELGNLSSVIFMSLAKNQLSGEIPPELGRLRSVISLALYRNQLTGEIPRELGNLSKLLALYLWGNQLSGEIPQELGDLSKLQGLYLSWNRLSGEIPQELGDLFELDSLSLDDNRLTGEIPTELGYLTNLDSLHLSHNRLSGNIPKELEDLFNLEWLGLGGNRDLAGCIPESLWEIPNTDLPSVGLPSCDGKVYQKPYYSIQGTVTGPNGEPLENVLIYARDVQTENYGGAPIDDYDHTETDGSFVIRVPDESYYLLIGNKDCNYVGAYDSTGFTRYTNEGTPVVVDGADVTGISIILPGDPNELLVYRTGSCYYL